MPGTRFTTPILSRSCGRSFQYMRSIPSCSIDLHICTPPWPLVAQYHKSQFSVVWRASSTHWTHSAFTLLHVRWITDCDAVRYLLCHVQDSTLLLLHTGWRMARYSKRSGACVYLCALRCFELVRTLADAKSYPPGRGVQTASALASHGDLLRAMKDLASTT